MFIFTLSLSPKTIDNIFTESAQICSVSKWMWMAQGWMNGWVEQTDRELPELLNTNKNFKITNQGIHLSCYSGVSFLVSDLILLDICFYFFPWHFIETLFESLKQKFLNLITITFSEK